MSSKVSSSKGKSGQSKQRQRHQNTYAFKADKYSSKQAEISALPVQGLCSRCADIISWRKRMGQYKPLTVPKKCVACSQKTVKDAYHILCHNCALSKNVCAKCQEAADIVPSSAVKTPAELLTEKQNEERLMGLMSERQRRSYLRKLERGDSDGAARIAEQVTVSAANEASDDGLSDFEDFDDGFMSDDE
ncbi:hypothetical protein HDU84_000470 [Entophlyctis sp. JEL0112]|nr:hypothetical protein HDU84_000470 [Entophlyctis sp. JEL0112]